MDRNPEYLKVPQVAEVLRIARSRAGELVDGRFPWRRYLLKLACQQFRIAEKNECDRLESIVDDMEHPGEVYSYEPLCRY